MYIRFVDPVKYHDASIHFQYQAYNLVPVLNVYENIVLPIELDGGKVNKDFVQQIVPVSYTHLINFYDPEHIEIVWKYRDEFLEAVG